jgi:hypothetical protein
MKLFMNRLPREIPSSRAPHGSPERDQAFIPQRKATRKHLTAPPFLIILLDSTSLVMA